MSFFASRHVWCNSTKAADHSYSNTVPHHFPMKGKIRNSSHSNRSMAACDSNSVMAALRHLGALRPPAAQIRQIRQIPCSEASSGGLGDKLIIKEQKTVRFTTGRGQETPSPSHATIKPSGSTHALVYRSVLSYPLPTLPDPFCGVFKAAIFGTLQVKITIKIRKLARVHIMDFETSFKIKVSTNARSLFL